MKRFHVHMHVDDLAKSIAFYSRLFAAEPARVETDYAKWMLEDPRVNFAISGHTATAHWGYADPSAGDSSDADKAEAFRKKPRTPSSSAWSCW